jgi:hypothetical protein
VNEATVLIAEAQVKEGVSQKSGKPYKRLVIKDGNGDFYSSFEEGLFEPALKAIGKKAVIGFEVEGNFKNLTALREVVEETPPKPGTGDYVTGQKPKIEIRRMCALNAAYQASKLTEILISRQAVTQELTPDLARATWDAMFDHVYNIITVRCDAVEPEQFPF